MIGVVFNPAAGGGRAGREWPAIERALRSRFASLETRITRARGDATRLARELLDAGAERIIAAGGDGTANEVLNAGCECLAMLPVGSAGDFSRSLGLPRAWPAALERIFAGAEETIDLGVATFKDETGVRVTRRFANIASFGLGARVVRRGRGRYLARAVAELWHDEPADIELCVDSDATRARFTHVAIGNGKYQGGGMMICPGARLEDGLLEVTAIEPVTLLELAVHVHKLYNGEIQRHPKVRSWRGAAIGAATRARVELELDGEPVGFLPVEVRIASRALRVIR